MSDEPLIQLRDLRKRFGSEVALDGVDLDVGAGEIVGYVGPNGAVLPFTEGARSQTHFDCLPRFMGLMLAMGLLIGAHLLVRLHFATHIFAVVAAVLLFRHGWRRLTRWRPELGRVRLRASRRSA